MLGHLAFDVGDGHPQKAGLTQGGEHCDQCRHDQEGAPMSDRRPRPTEQATYCGRSDD
jgi:hypothetical protein